MKPWLKRTLIGLFGASVLFTGLAAWSQHRHHGCGWQSMSDEDAAKLKARFVDRAGSYLDLDEAQKQRLGTLADRLHAQRNALVGGGDPRAELRSLIDGPAFDRAKALSLVDAKTAAVTARAPEVVTALADFFDSLRPEQQQKLRELADRRRWRDG